MAQAERARLLLERRPERPLARDEETGGRTLAYDGMAVPPILPLSPFAVVVGSFSKSLSLAGERVGYLLVNPEMPDAQVLLDALTMTIRTLGFVNAPVVGQRLVEALVDASVDVGVYDRRRKAMAAALRGAGIDFFMPQGAFYFFPKAPGGDDQAFVELLLEENVLAVPGGPTIAELASVGVRRVSTGSLLAAFAYGALVTGANELLEQGTSQYTEGGVSRELLRAAFG